MHWNFGGAVSLADVLAICFLISYAIADAAACARERPRSLLGFFGAFVLVYLIGFYNLETSRRARRSSRRGFVKFVIHFVFLAAAVAWLWRRGQTYYWRTLALVLRRRRVQRGLRRRRSCSSRAAAATSTRTCSRRSPAARARSTSTARSRAAKVFRPNALTGDPNHLGIMLIVPLLVLTPIYLRLERGHRLRRRLAILIGFLFLVELATLSRSGLLGLGVGAIVLALPYRRYLWSRALLAPLAGALAVLGVVVLTRAAFLRGRAALARQHERRLPVRALRGLQLHPADPALAIRCSASGLNNFSVYYEFVTGKTNWGPHSFYVSLVVETGLVGTALFASFLFWVFRAAARAREAARPRLSQLRTIRSPRACGRSPGG